MKTKEIFILIVTSHLIVGCEFSLLSRGSSEAATKAPPLTVDTVSLPPLGVGFSTDVTWETDDSDETVDIEISDNGTDWTSIGSVPANDQIYSVQADDILLPDGLYEVRLKTFSQVFDLGDVILDRIAPVAGADQYVDSCDIGIASEPFVLNAGSDGLAPVVYEVVTPPAVGTITGCLNNTGATACLYQGSTVGDAFTMSYRVVDQVGNRSPVAMIAYEHVICN